MAPSLIILIKFFHIILKLINEAVFGQVIKIIKSSHLSREQTQVQLLLMENCMFLEGVVENIFLMIFGILILRIKYGSRLLQQKRQK